MAKYTLADLDKTAANNTDVLAQSTQGTQLVSTIDTMIQSQLGMLARYYGDIGGLGVVAGTANAITLTSVSSAGGGAYQSLTSGLHITFKASAINTTAVTLNLDGLGAKAIRRQGDTALAAGDIKANGRYDLIYDTAYNSAAGAWVLMDPGQMTGDSGSGGTTGLVPAPASGDGTSRKSLLADGTWGRDLEVWGIAVSDEITALTTGTAKGSFSIPYAFKVVGVYATLNTVSSSGTPTFDINEAGVSILGTKIVIDVSEFTGGSAGYQGTASGAATIADDTIAAFAQITVDIDTAGTGTKGAKVFLVGYRNS